MSSPIVGGFQVMLRPVCLSHGHSSATVYIMPIVTTQH